MMLTLQQMTTLQAAVDRIIPADDFPGGWEAGVGEYLNGQFERDLAPLVETYRNGLDALDAEALARAEASFAELDPAEQDALLTDIEAGTTRTTWLVDPATFFQMLVNHSMEGYYGDPGNGGNRGGVAWEMIGFEVRG